MGETNINGKYKIKNITQLRFRLPLNCNPGTLEVYKQGYKKLVFGNLNPTLEEEINLGEVHMDSKKPFKLHVKKIEANDNRRSNGKSFDTNEYGFLIFSNLEDDSIIEVVEIDKENQYNLTIDLMPGNYSIEGFIIYNKTFIIPEEEICYETGLFSSEECEVIPEIEFKSWVKGGIEIERFETNFPQLFATNHVYVNFIDMGIPENYDELKILSSVMSDLKGISQNKEPYFEK